MSRCWCKRASPSLNGDTSPQRLHREHACWLSENAALIVSGTWGPSSIEECGCGLMACQCAFSAA